jgi:WD40 repeat protein
MKLNINIISVILGSYTNNDLLLLTWKGLRQKIMVEYILFIRLRRYKNFISKTQLSSNNRETFVTENRRMPTSDIERVNQIIQIDDNRLAIVYKNIINIWEINLSRCIKTLGVFSQVTALFVHDGKLYYSTLNKFFRVFYNGESIVISSNNYGYICIISHFEATVLAGDNFGWIYAYKQEGRTYHQSQIFQLHNYQVTIIKVLRCGDVLTAGNDGNICILNNALKVKTWLTDHLDAIESVEEYENILYTVSLDSTIRLWKKYKCITTLAGLSPLSNIFIYSKDLFITVSSKGQFKLWKENKFIKTITLNIDNKCGCMKLYDGRLLFTHDIELKILNPSSLNVMTVLGDYGDFECIYQMRDERVVTGNLDGFKIWNLTN